MFSACWRSSRYRRLVCAPVNHYINAQTYFSVCADSGRAASPNWVKRKTIEIARLQDNEGAIPYFREMSIYWLRVFLFGQIGKVG
jgi:hypothetical protein